MIAALGFKDHRNPGNELDVSNRDDVINIAPHRPGYGVYMPEALCRHLQRLNGPVSYLADRATDSPIPPPEHAAHVDGVLQGEIPVAR